MTKTTTTGRGRGRPKKVPSAIETAQQANPNVVKRGRGRPRKYPPKANPPPADLGKDQPELKKAPLDLLGFLKPQGMASTWGSVQKGKRLNARRAGGWVRECRKENSGDLGFPSARESDYASSTESNSILNPEDSWISDFEIPGPIPDLATLYLDLSILGQEDFFSDLPDDWDFPLD